MRNAKAKLLMDRMGVQQWKMETNEYLECALLANGIILAPGAVEQFLSDVQFATDGDELVGRPLLRLDQRGRLGPRRFAARRSILPFRCSTSEIPTMRTEINHSQQTFLS